MGRMLVSEEVHEKLVSAANKMGEAYEELTDLYLDILPDVLPKGFKRESEIFASIDNARYDVRHADEEFEHAYAILVGEDDDGEEDGDDGGD